VLPQFPWLDLRDLLVTEGMGGEEKGRGGKGKGKGGKQKGRWRKGKKGSKVTRI